MIANVIAASMMNMINILNTNCLTSFFISASSLKQVAVNATQNISAATRMIKM
jgi:hypothetical protein